MRKLTEEEKFWITFWRGFLKGVAVCAPIVYLILTKLYDLGIWAYNNSPAIRAGWDAYWTTKGGLK